MNLVKTDSTPIVSQRGGQLYTTSLDMAEKFEKRHKDVLRAISNLDCSEEFMRRSFAPHAYTDDRGNTQPMFYVSRDGFQFLAMGFRGKKAAAWKEKYIAAFNLMEKAIRRRHDDPFWLDRRDQGVIARREETDIIQLFVEYATSQGSKNARFYYKNITSATYKALFIVQCNVGQSFRDLLDSRQLSFLQTAEYIAAEALEDGMNQGLFYKDIYQLAKGRIERYADTVPRTEVISMHGGYGLPLLQATA